jgi:hypothetical protein
MKKWLSFLLLSSMTLSFATIASAKNSKSAPSSEDAVYSDTYDVEGYPELKVRVDVHHANKSSNPGSGSTLVCGLSDPDSSTVVPSTGWHLPSSVTYRLNTSSAPGGISSVLATVAGNAFSQWSSAVSGKVQFTRGSNTSVSRAQFDGQNIIAFGRTSASALAVTYTWYNQTTGLVSETDTIFNSRYSWSWVDQSVHSGCAFSNSYDVQDILTHETGHWMGLDDTYDTSFTDNTMFGYGSTKEVKKDTLSSGDVVGVNSIY